jgi:CPA2 family monovalent cation:H+ antiporter-2
VLEMNKDTVREMKKEGEPIYYGDGTSATILEKIGLRQAKVLVLAISDAASTRRILQTARTEHGSLHIIVRTRYVSEVDDLIKLGANEVIPEEFETSIEIFSMVLDHFSLPRNVINDYIDIIRRNSYDALRKNVPPQKRLSERQDIMRGINTDSYLVKDDSELPGRTIQETRLRVDAGSSILAVERGGHVHQNPSPEFVLAAGDVLVLIGSRTDLHRAMEHLTKLTFPK